MILKNQRNQTEHFKTEGVCNRKNCVKINKLCVLRAFICEKIAFYNRLTARANDDMVGAVIILTV